MLQNLLAERFQLKVHRATKVMAAYALVVDKKGPKLQPGIPGKDGMATGRGLVQGHNATLAQFAEMLSLVVGRPVQDLTGCRLEQSEDQASQGALS